MSIRRIVLFLLLSLGLMPLAQGAIPASERAVLDALYASTNGANWTKKTGWGGAAGTECSWYGITCSGTNVTRISMENNNMTGSLPSLSGLTALQYLDVGFNQLAGTLPSLSGLTALNYVYASYNQLTGPLPSLSGLTALTDFSVEDNPLTGPIPSLSGLTALRNFYVGGNQLTGSIPSLSGLNALQNFGAGGNQLTGSIPSLSGLTALQAFRVMLNQLTGPVAAAPASLIAGQSNLCNNSLTSSGNSAIDAAWVAAQNTSPPYGVAGGNWLACQIGAAGTPACTLSASPASIAPGASSTLTATCSPAATSYVWSGGTCAGTTGATCTVSPSASTTYSVTGSNAAGKGNTASATVTPFTVQSTVVNNTVKAVVNYNTADTNKTGSVFIFGYLPANSPLFGSAAKSASAPSNVPMAGTNLVLAVLTASGWQQVLGGGSVPPVYSGALNTSTSAFALYVAGLFNQSQDAGIMCVAYTTSSAASFTDQGLPVVVGKDPSVTCPSLTLTNNPQAGVWWNPDEGGRGFVIEQSGYNLFLGTFLYDSSGRSTWYAASGVVNGNTFSSTLTIYTSGQTLTGAYKAPVVSGNAGTISITFSDTSHGTLTWPGGTIPIQRFDIVTGGAAMTPAVGTPETGMWWNPAESGRGFALEIQNGTMFLGGYMYDASGNPLWYSSGPTPMTNALTYVGTWSQYGNGQTLTGAYNPATVVNSNVGTVRIQFSDTQNALLTLPDGKQIPLTRFRF